MTAIPLRIAEELGVAESQVAATISLLDEGATVPFVARYRKEATGGLDDSQLRNLEERLRYLRELEERRAAILESVESQGKLTDALKADIEAAETKARLEDLYLPYRPKKRTKAQIAREAGLEPLADALLGDPALDPQAEAAGYVDSEKGVADAQAALDGARQILMERFAEDAELVGGLRQYLWDNGRLVSEAVEGKETEGAKFADYFQHSEPLKSVPSHRALALFRGRNEGVLRLSIVDGQADPDGPAEGERRVAARFGIADQGRPADAWLADTARRAWRVKIALHLEMDLMTSVREAAEAEAIQVFAANLGDLLMAAPAGQRAVIGLDPGYRTGVKVAVVDATGKLVDTATIHPHEPKKKWDESVATLAGLAGQHGAALVAIGNGTASRETDRLAGDLIKAHPDLGLAKVLVSEAGASVYSASERASKEFPDLDVSLRGAVSIARRLQDPLAELVKIDPKSIGVGQYQHDVNQTRLGRALDAVVEDCVNRVGVDLNTASAPLLARVAGLSEGLAGNIVAKRDADGPFARRRDLLDVPRLGAKAFEQCAGFLRIIGGSDPLDASAVHPEAYPVVQRILDHTGRDIAGLMGDTATLRGLDPAAFTDDTFGVPTVTDILAELEKPGRDPRPEFKTATFQEGVEKISDLAPGMVLEGVVSNVTNFGAFVDVGVHQDGLVHISALADKFVEDPRSVVKAGDVVKVKVLEVDLERKRISLSMRMDDAAAKDRPKKDSRPKGKGKGKSKGKDKPTPRSQPRPADGAMAEAFARARKGKNGK